MASAAGVCKVGMEEGCPLPGRSAIVELSGELAALTNTLEDEVIAAAVDFARCRVIRDPIFHFAILRGPGNGGLIAAV